MARGACAASSNHVPARVDPESLDSATTGPSRRKTCPSRRTSSALSVSGDCVSKGVSCILGLKVKGPNDRRFTDFQSHGASLVFECGAREWHASLTVHGGRNAA